MTDIDFVSLPALALFALAGIVTTLYVYFRISDGARWPGLILSLIVGGGLFAFGLGELSLVPAVWMASAVGVYGPAGYTYCITTALFIGSLGILDIRDWRNNA